MSPATNVGAATPVAIIGGPPSPDKKSPLDKASEDETEEDGQASEKSEDVDAPDTSMERKAINDSVAYIRGLAKRRDRRP